MDVRPVVLVRQPRGVRVVRLTPELAAALKAQAAVALNGDGSCSLQAMRTSCFASENCAHGGGSQRHSAMQLDVLLSQPHAFVAVSDVAPDGTTRLAEDAFVGCVSCGPARHSYAARLFPQTAFSAHAHVLSNLCVASDYRGHNVGRRLVDAVVGVGDVPQNTYLLVARGSEQTPELAEAFRDRVARLRATYAKLDFAHECECEHAHLFRHR
jgi:GNAT superfamily N-acetyltransferase